MSRSQAQPRVTLPGCERRAVLLPQESAPGAALEGKEDPIRLRRYSSTAGIRRAPTMPPAPAQIRSHRIRKPRQKMLLPRVNSCLEQSKSRFDRDPCRDRPMACVPRRSKSPSPDRLHSALVKPQADSFRQADLRRAPVRVHEDQQRHAPLQLGLPRLIGVLWVGTVRALRRRHSRSIKTRGPAPSGLIARRATNRISQPIANGVAFSSATGTVLSGIQGSPILSTGVRTRVADASRIVGGTGSSGLWFCGRVGFRS